MCVFEYNYICINLDIIYSQGHRNLLRFIKNDAKSNPFLIIIENETPKNITGTKNCMLQEAFSYLALFFSQAP